MTDEPRIDGGRGVAVGVGLLVVIASTFTLFFGRAFFLPIAFAFALHPLFRPVVRWLNRVGMPVPVAAAAVVLLIVAALVGGAFAVSVPLKDWLARAPETFDKAEAKFARLRGAAQQVTSVAERIERAADVTGGGATQPAASRPSGDTAAPRSEPGERTAAVAPAPAGQGFSGRALGMTTAILGGVTEVLVLLLLLLASGDLFYRKLLKVMPRRQDKREAAEVVEEAQSVVIRYVAVTALINVGQAVLVALVLWWLGVPSPLIWGLATFVLEFIPYLGATIMICLLSVVAFASFDDAWRIAAAPGSYLLITTLQNNIVSPVAYGDRLKLNPVAVLIGVLFWWFVWGIGGAFLAVPIIATVKIVSSHTKSFGALAEFLGE